MRREVGFWWEIWEENLQGEFGGTKVFERKIIWFGRRKVEDMWWGVQWWPQTWIQWRVFNTASVSTKYSALLIKMYWFANFLFEDGVWRITWGWCNTLAHCFCALLVKFTSFFIFIFILSLNGGLVDEVMLFFWIWEWEIRVLHFMMESGVKLPLNNACNHTRWCCYMTPN